MKSLSLSLLFALPALAQGDFDGRINQDGWCVILGAFPQQKFAPALAFTQQAQAKGLKRAAIYEARAFKNFAWGDLVVIAEWLQDREQARKTAQAAQTLGLSAYSKSCPLQMGPTQPIRNLKELKAPWSLPKIRPKVEAKSPESWSGCFAWSPKREIAACLTGETSIQGEGQDSILFLGKQSQGFKKLRLWSKSEDQQFAEADMRLNPREQRSLRQDLKRGGFFSLSKGTKASWMRILKVRGLLHWGAPRISLRWKRKTEEIVEEMEGSWNSHEESLEFRCGGPKGVWHALLGFNTHDDEPRLSAGLLPGSKILLLEWSDSWSIGGDMGSSTISALIDAERCALIQSSQ